MMFALTGMIQKGNNAQEKVPYKHEQQVYPTAVGSPRVSDRLGGILHVAMHSMQLRGLRHIDILAIC